MANMQSIGSGGVPLDRQVTELVKRLKAFNEKAVPLAFASGANRAAGQARTQIIKGVAGAVLVPQNLIRKRVYVHKATRNDLVAKVISYYGGINMIRLNPRDTGRYKKGRRGRVGRGVHARGGHSSDFGWIGKGKGGNRLVFELAGGSKKKTVIKSVYIPIHEEVGRLAPAEVRRVATTKLPDLIAHDLRWRLGKFEAKA